ncbi:hypothetical protein Y695_02021 [Hydrogenophaga sp. T4]|nr:hypothetical protein Y695_02021 [Hydrogenophaga sp. T4]
MPRRCGALKASALVAQVLRRGQAHLALFGNAREPPGSNQPHMPVRQAFVRQRLQATGCRDVSREVRQQLAVDRVHVHGGPEHRRADCLPLSRVRSTTSSASTTRRTGIQHSVTSVPFRSKSSRSAGRCQRNRQQPCPSKPVGTPSPLVTGWRGFDSFSSMHPTRPSSTSRGSQRCRCHWDRMRQRDCPSGSNSVPLLDAMTCCSNWQANWNAPHPGWNANPRFGQGVASRTC